MSPILIVVIIIVIVLVVVLIGDLQRAGPKRIRIDEAFAQIEVQLKRRHDLIPNLVNAVKGYMGFEQKVLTDVTERPRRRRRRRRPGPGPAGRGRERPDRHPPLAVRGRRELPRAQGQRERPGAPGAADDDREPDLVLAPALQRHGPRLQHAIQTFPAVLIAGMFGFTKREFFDAEPEAATVPNVDLSLS